MQFRYTQSLLQVFPHTELTLSDIIQVQSLSSNDRLHLNNFDFFFNFHFADQY